jgi:hypothetical protein
MLAVMSFTSKKATSRLALRRVALLAGLAATLASLIAAGVAALPASAVTLGTPLALDAFDDGNPPQIAYDPSTQTTYVAWQAPGSLNQENGVELCVLPHGATACESGSAVLLTDSQYPAGEKFLTLGRLVVEPNGNVVVLGVGNTGPTVAWESGPGGGAFFSGNQGLQNDGEAIGVTSLFYSDVAAVPLGNTDVGLLDDEGESFTDATVSGPEAPRPSSGYANVDPCTLPATGFGCEYPGSIDGTSGSALAAMIDPADASDDIVVGVGQNEEQDSGEATPPGCVNSGATGYGVSVGTVDGQSKAAHTLNGEGLPAYQLLECSAATPTLVESPSLTGGIGVFEQEGSGFTGASNGSYTLDYRPFAPTESGGVYTGGTFGAPVQLEDITTFAFGGADNLDASEDAGNGIYTSWQDEQGTVMDYSANRGAAWEGPVVIPQLSTGASQGNPVIVGVGGGTVLLAYDANLGEGNQVFLQAINLLPPTPTSTSTTQASGAASAADISISAGTVGETDTAKVAGTDAATAGGTMTYTLSSASNCAAANQVFHQTTAVTDGVAAPATVTSALPPGTYYWSASYSGDLANQASSSACGSEVLTVTPATTPSSEFKVKVIVTNSNGTITITIVVEQSGEATLEVTISTTTLAHSSAVDAKSKKCKHGQIKLKGKCVSATTVVGKTSAKATAGVPLKLTVHLSNKIKSLLKKGKTVHLTGKLTFQSALGGKPKTHTYNLTVKGHKSKHKK